MAERTHKKRIEDMRAKSGAPATRRTCTHAFRELRRTNAWERQQIRDGRTPQEQLHVLDARLGGGYQTVLTMGGHTVREPTAGRERARLIALVNAPKPATTTPKTLASQGSRKAAARKRQVFPA